LTDAIEDFVESLIGIFRLADAKVQS